MSRQPLNLTDPVMEGAPSSPRGARLAALLVWLLTQISQTVCYPLGRSPSPASSTSERWDAPLCFLWSGVALPVGAMVPAWCSCGW